MSLTVGKVRWGRSFYIYHWQVHRYCVAHAEALCEFDRVASYDLMRDCRLVRQVFMSSVSLVRSACKVSEAA